ncbi:MAG: endolytic transglycosylase MltG [Candidatus Nanopelagicales bacterium]
MKKLIDLGRSQLIVGAVIGLIFIAIGFFQIYQSGPRESWSGNGEGEVTIEIPAGVNLTEVGRILAAAGVVEAASFFAIATYDREEAKLIQPGRYLMALRMGSDEAIDRLLDPASKQQLRIAIPEGLRLSSVVALLAKRLSLNEDEVIAAIKRLEKNELPTKLPNYADESAEGFLYPATYQFPDNVNIDQVLTEMVNRFFQAERNLNLINESKRLGFTPRELLTMASLVEAEAFPADFGKVARTILNRLKANMPLQFDATVNYALGTNKLLFTESEFQTDSPYNTYRYPGLPPGPIGSPGEGAMSAVINPPAGDWLYFVSTNPDKGITKFTGSYQEFLKFRAEFQAWYRENR